MKSYDLNGNELNKAYSKNGSELAEVYPLNADLRFSVLGDSYSTFSGYIPQSNWSYYPKNDVDDVSEMWWYIVDEETKYTRDIINAWSGGTVCLQSASTKGAGSPFVRRINGLGEPNLIFILGGLNDASHEAPLGEYKYSNFTEEDLDYFRPSCAYVISQCRTLYPEATIVWITEAITAADYLTSIHTICSEMGIPCLDPVPEIVQRHPTAAGQATIANVVINWMEANL